METQSTMKLLRLLEEVKFQEENSFSFFKIGKDIYLDENDEAINNILSFIDGLIKISNKKTDKEI